MHRGQAFGITPTAASPSWTQGPGLGAREQAPHTGSFIVCWGEGCEHKSRRPALGALVSAGVSAVRVRRTGIYLRRVPQHHRCHWGLWAERDPDRQPLCQAWRGASGRRRRASDLLLSWGNKASSRTLLAITSVQTQQSGARTDPEQLKWPSREGNQKSLPYELHLIRKRPFYETLIG